MSKKYFNYSFQIKRTKNNAIILLIVIAVAILGFIYWYNNRTERVKVEKLSYKVVFGMNEFSSAESDKAYRLNYKKNTCSTVCIKKITQNENYLSEIKKDMEEDDFEFSKIKSKKLGNKTWKYIETKNNEPIISYYMATSKEYTYTIEYINQTKYLDDETTDKCNEIIDNMTKSMKLK